MYYNVYHEAPTAGHYELRRTLNDIKSVSFHQLNYFKVAINVLRKLPSISILKSKEWFKPVFFIDFKLRLPSDV